VLFNGLDERLPRDPGPIDKKSEVTGRAAKMEVALKLEDGG
jgi:hypothetical protein